MPAIPALIVAGGTIASGYMASRAAKKTAETMAARSPEETALMKSQTGLMDQSKRQGSQVFNTAMPKIQATTDYYSTLLNGNRSARMGAVSQEAEDVGASYAGADKLVKKQMVGGERDQALAENARAKAGNVARLVTGVRPAAAGALGDMGTNLLGTSSGFTSGAANVGTSLLSNATQNRQNAGLLGLQAGQGASANWGALLANLMKMYPQGGTRGGGQIYKTGSGDTPAGYIGG